MRCVLRVEGTPLSQGIADSLTSQTLKSICTNLTLSPRKAYGKYVKLTAMEFPRWLLPAIGAGIVLLSLILCGLIASRLLLAPPAVEDPQPPPTSADPPTQSPQDAVAATLAALTAQAPTAPPSSTPRPEPSGRIVYTCQLSGQSDLNQICLMNADGSGFRRLTTADSADHLYPTFAPDGSSILYTSNVTGDYDLYALNLAGGSAERMTTFGDAYAPAVSPDGSQIVFTRADGETSSLWLMNRDGSNARFLVGQAWDAAWSPDGTRILHASDRTGEIQLFILTLADLTLQQVTDQPGLRGRNDWSPDGQTLATYIGEPWNREIWLFDAAGGPGRQITNGGNNLAPGYSLDGHWIVITAYYDLYRDDNGCEIYLIRPDGSDLRRLTENDYCDWQPSWGP